LKSIIYFLKGSHYSPGRRFPSEEFVSCRPSKDSFPQWRFATCAPGQDRWCLAWTL